MKPGTHHTEKTKRGLRAWYVSNETRVRLRDASIRARDAKMLEMATELPFDLAYKRHYEPDLHPEVIAIQDRLLARFGRNRGWKIERQPQREPEKFELYAMTICQGCGRINQTSFAGCTNCDNGQAVIIR